MMESLKEYGINHNVLLWSDDNLSTDFFWRFLTDKQIEFYSTYKNYSKVCCFKGIDENSYLLNTNSKHTSLSSQFQLFNAYLTLGIDLYGYITLTSPSNTDFHITISKLFDKFQSIHENLPLRIIPLKIELYNPVKVRFKHIYQDLLYGQELAMEQWLKQISNRFSSTMTNTPITEINIR